MLLRTVTRQVSAQALRRCATASCASSSAATSSSSAIAALRVIPRRFVSSDKSLQDDAPSMQQQRSKASKSIYDRAVAIENVTTATEGDSDLTLGEGVKRQYRQTSSTFVDMSINDVLHSKAKYGNTLHTVSEKDSIAKALQAMNHYSIGAILVTGDDQQSIVGIFSTRDLIKCIDDNTTVDVKKTPVGEMMSRDPVFAYSDTTALQAMHMMNEGGFRHLPVRSRHNGHTVGLVSIGDLVRAMMKEHEQKNEYLEDFVSGKYPA